MFVLGLDPGLSTSGYGLVEDAGGSQRAVAAGVIRTSPPTPVAARLAELHQDLVAIIEEYRPGVMAIEQVFTNRNLQTAIAVGRASGVAMLAAGQRGLEVYEYTPSAVKLAVTGFGRAPKSQVRDVVASRLGVALEAPADASDALAIALCHLQHGRLVAS